MSFDIDMKSYAGENRDSAAGNQTAVVDTNSYQQEAGEYPVDTSLLDAPPQSVAPPAESHPDVNPQSEHFRALREEVDRIKAQQEGERREHQLQLDMLRANIERQSRPAPTQPERQFLDGMKEDEIPNVGELRREWANKEAAYQSKLEELQVAQQYSDYAEVLQTFVAPLITQKPYLAEGIRNSPNSALMAYELGKMAQAAQHKQTVETKSENAQRIVENAKKPGTLSQAGGQGALSKADYFATMSDQEFMRMASRNLEGI